MTPPPGNVRPDGHGGAPRGHRGGRTLQGGERVSDDGTMHGGQDGNSQVRGPLT